jgi:ABC-2 type transport system ATP-binding protein
VLAEGAPDGVAALAQGNVIQASPPAGQTPRAIQARLLDNADVVDAVPEGGKVRIVRAAASATFAGISIAPTAPRFEDGFMVLLRRRAPPPSSTATLPAPRPASQAGEIVVEVDGLVRQFGSFTAVDHVSFAVRRGEIFGLLGPNGAGKTTTFRMLCGLLPATHGKLRIAGIDLSRARAAAHQRFGYVAQKFALYGDLSVAENLEFFASAYGLHDRKRRDRIAWALAQFDLAAHEHEQSGDLPNGYKRRLAMAAALLHEPETLFLDEPTSGADPFARRDFWRRITVLSEQGVTIVVTSHFMEEAEYCDHVVILDQGRVLAKGTPAGIRGHASSLGRGPAAGMEDAFIAIVEAARNGEAMPGLAA